MRTDLLLLSLLGIAFLNAPGCAKPCPPSCPPVPVCHQFHAPGFDWSTVRRILLVPLSNDSTYPHSTFEFQETLAARLQCSGRFEVVIAPREAQLACRDAVRIYGSFDEAELLEIAEDYHADAICFGTITQYQPYAPPRVGLSLRLISPGSAAVISSVDGLWDSRDKSVAEQARAYAALTLNDDQSLLACDITSGSPILFRRFACHYAVEALVNPVQYPEMGSPSIQQVSTQPASNAAPGAPTLQPQPAPPDTVYPPLVPPVPMESSEASTVPVLPTLPVEVPDEASAPNGPAL